MEDKNVKDIIIEDAETSKGSQLKNILILLALLFIILVVSIVITRLILGGDDSSDTAHLRADGTVQEIGENNLTGTVSDGLASATSGAGHAAATAGAAALAGAAATVALTSKNSDDKSDTKSETTTASSSTVKAPLLADRNTTAKTKVPLRTEEPKKNTASASSTKKATTHHTSSHSTTKHSTYTAPKYVKKKTTTIKTTTKKSSTKKTSTHHASSHRTSSHSSKKVTRGYYIKVGAFDNPSTAIRSIKAIKLNYRTTKTKKGLTRVLIGPFYSQRDAQNHLSKAKANVAADAYISKIK